MPSQKDDKLPFDQPKIMRKSESDVQHPSPWIQGHWVCGITTLYPTLPLRIWYDRKRWDYTPRLACRHRGLNLRASTSRPKVPASLQVDHGRLPLYMHKVSIPTEMVNQLPRGDGCSPDSRGYRVGLWIKAHRPNGIYVLTTVSRRIRFWDQLGGTTDGRFSCTGQSQ